MRRLNKYALIVLAGIVVAFIAITFFSGGSGDNLPVVDQYLYKTRDDAVIGTNVIGSVSELDTGNMSFRGLETVDGVTVGSAQFLQAPGQPVLWYVIETQQLSNDVGTDRDVSQPPQKNDNVIDVAYYYLELIPIPGFWLAVLMLVAVYWLNRIRLLSIERGIPEQLTLNYKGKLTKDNAVIDNLRFTFNGYQDQTDDGLDRFDSNTGDNDDEKWASAVNYIEEQLESVVTRLVAYYKSDVLNNMMADPRILELLAAACKKPSYERGIISPSVGFLSLRINEEDQDDLRAMRQAKYHGDAARTYGEAAGINSGLWASISLSFSRLVTAIGNFGDMDLFGDQNGKRGAK